MNYNTKSIIKSFILFIGFIIYLYLFIFGINGSSEIKRLEIENKELIKENNRVLKYKITNISLNNTIKYLNYSIDEYKENINKLESKFQDDISILKSKLLQCDNQLINEIKSNIQQQKQQLHIQLQQHKKTIETTTTPNTYIQHDEIIPILIPTCNRTNYLERTLNSILKIRKNIKKFPIIISQDCNDIGMNEFLDGFSLGNEIIILKNPNKTWIQPYESISRNYKWMLTQVFDRFSYDKVLIVEDDLEVSIDFLDYFEKLSPLLDLDQSLFCISAWNDNGKTQFINQNESIANLLFYRTDFFPGLGWMLKNKFWQQIKHDWPIQYWDDYLRSSFITSKNIQCIRPEISRVKNIGESGATNTQVYDTYIKEIKRNEIQVDYSNYDINQLMEPQFKHSLNQTISAAQLIYPYEIETFGYRNRTLKITFRDKYDYQMLAKQFGLIDDTRDEISRTSYKKIVGFYFKSNLIYFIPRDGINW